MIGGKGETDNQQITSCLRIGLSSCSVSSARDHRINTEVVRVHIKIFRLLLMYEPTELR